MNLNIPIKSSGSTLTADEFNQTVAAVNSKADESQLLTYLTLSGATSAYQPKGDYLTSVTWSLINDKPSFFSGNYSDLVGKPVLFSGAYSDLTSKPVLFSGSYSDLTNKPTIPSIAGLATESFVLNSLTGKSNVSEVYSKTEIDSKAFLTGVTYAQVSGKPDLSTKADLVNGLIPTTQLPDAVLNSLQFEVLQDGSIGIRTSYLQSLGLGGTGTTTPTLAAPTGFNLSGATASAITISWSTVANATSYQVERANNAGYTGSTTVFTGSTLSFNDTSLTASTNYYYRVKAKASGYNDSVYATASGATIATSTGGTAYQVESTYLIDFGSEYGSYPDSPPPYWNVMKPSASLLQTASGYTSPFIVNTGNTASTMKLTNSGQFNGATGEISSAQSAAGNVGVFENAAINTAWTVNNSTAKLKITGLLANKFYQLYFLMPVGEIPSVRGVTIGATTKNKTATTVLASFGLAANGLNDAEWIVFNNITGTEVEALVKSVSGGGGGAFLSSMVIEQTNIAKA